jgi:hypothetical protein
LNKDRTLEENWIPWLWSRDEGSIFQEQQWKGWGDVEEKQEWEAPGDQTMPCQAAGEAGAPLPSLISSSVFSATALPKLHVIKGSNRTPQFLGSYLFSLSLEL